MISFGKALKNARKARRVTLRKLSEYVDKSISYLSEIENDRKRPPELETVRKMEEYLNVENGSLITLAAKIRKRVPKEWTERIMTMPKLSQVLLRADQDLTDDEFQELMDLYDELKKKRRNR